MILRSAYAKLPSSDAGEIFEPDSNESDLNTKQELCADNSTDKGSVTFNDKVRKRPSHTFKRVIIRSRMEDSTDNFDNIHTSTKQDVVVSVQPRKLNIDGLSSLQYQQKLCDTLNSLYGTTKIIDEFEAKSLVTLLKQKDEETLLKVVTTICNLAAFTVNQDIFRKCGAIDCVVDLFIDQSISSTIRLMLIQCIGNMAVNTENHSLLQSAVPWIVQAFLGSECSELQKIISVETLTNLTAEILPQNESKFEPVVQTVLNSYVDRFPFPGETIKGSKFLTALGGKGCNQAIQCGKLGANVAIVGKVGLDHYGESILKNLDETGIDRTFVKRTDEFPTGTATIIVSKDGKNFIVVNVGANFCLTCNDVLSAERVIKGAKVLVCQLEIEPGIVLESLRIAKKHGVLTILNMAPCPEDLDNRIITQVDVLCFNEMEAQTLTGVNFSNHSGIPGVFEVAFGMSPSLEIVILTMGDQGCYFSTRPNTRVIHHVATEKVISVDTTGAGDSFVGSLAFYMAQFPTLSVSEKVRRSCVIASRSVLKQGAQPSYLNRAQLEGELFM